jgi:hypothetical protein
MKPEVVAAPFIKLNRLVLAGGSGCFRQSEPDKMTLIKKL